MFDSKTPNQKDAYIKLLKNGKPMIFLHHSLVSYQHWPEFTRIIGGKYNTEDSTMSLSDYVTNISLLSELSDRVSNFKLRKERNIFSSMEEFLE